MQDLKSDNLFVVLFMVFVPFQVLLNQEAEPHVPIARQ
jgi:hypothetical protein